MIVGHITDPTDILGNARFIDGNGDSTAAWDIGAYEFNSFKPPRFAVQPQRTAGGWTLNINGALNRWARLQRSADLKKWEEIGSPVYLGEAGAGQSSTPIPGRPGCSTGWSFSSDLSSVPSWKYDGWMGPLYIAERIPSLQVVRLRDLRLHPFPASNRALPRQTSGGAHPRPTPAPASWASPTSVRLRLTGRGPPGV